MPGTGKACATCNTKKVWCSFLGTKPSVKVIVSSDKEVVTARPKKAKTLGIMPRAGKVLVEVGKLAEGSVEILNAIQQLNAG
jgi:hypothetical protein